MTPFQKSLIERIQKEGPLDFATVMELSNTHYYAHKTVFGAEGDFITAPEISQIFGEIVAVWCVDQMHKCSATTVMELGPGRGILMQDLTRVFDKLKAPVTDLILVEASSNLTEIQKQALASSTFPISWQKTLPPPLTTPCLFIANEFLDALPVEVLVTTGNAPGKLSVNWSANAGFMYSHDPKNNTLVERSLDAEEILQHICAHIKNWGGAALFIDYGDYTAKNRRGFTVQAVKDHAYVKPLEHLGEADITFHIDFHRLESIATEHGLAATVSTQRDFLKEYGFDQRLESLLKFCRDDNEKQDVLSRALRLIDPTQMGTLFKVLEIKKAS